MSNKSKFYILLSAFSALHSLSAAPFVHAIYDEMALNGAWEMAYQPYEYAREVRALPTPRYVAVAQAIPGYWEDMIPAFRAAGMREEFRIHPLYRQQTFPISGWAMDTTLPNIYGCFFYRRTIVLDRIPGKALLAFEGVRNQVHVWVNGRFAGFRQGFSTPFEMALPKAAFKAGGNEIVLAVSNNPNLGYGDFVSGLTTRALFGGTGGVNGRLTLRFPRNDMADIYVTTAKDLKTFTVHVSGATPYDYAIYDGAQCRRTGKGQGDVTLPTAGLAFWSPENPKRYQLRLTTAAGTCSLPFGIRRLTTEGEEFRLNGQPYYLRGVTEHCYFPTTVHLPRDLDYYRMITRKRKELGFNFVRFHTFVPPVEYLEAMDELGMVAHIESPNFVAEPEYAAIIAFARRHPCAVIYCTGNETRIDRLAETYLEDVANLVHTMSDALFSPMSALRGIEYCLMSGKDEIVKDSVAYNAARVKRMSRYCDMWTSYQLGATSYDSLNGRSAATLDEWGDHYAGKPRTSHEICIDGSYVDLGLEALYPKDSPIVKAGIFSGLRAQFEKRGMLDKADLYFRNSCEWMRRIRKHAFEKLRHSRRTAGYDFLGDINTHWHTFGYSVGMMDEFYRLKPGETVENVRRYNSAAVLLSDLGSDFVVAANEKKCVTFTLSNFDRDIAKGCLEAGLYDAETGACVSKSSVRFPDRVLRNGAVTKLGTLDFFVPSSEKPRKYWLRAKLAGVCENEWEIYAFPRVKTMPMPAGVRVVSDISKEDLLVAMARGETVLLLGAGPFKSQPSTYRIGMAGRCAGDFATVVKDHPALGDFPHEGWCGWAFRRLMEGGRTVQLEGGIPFDPIIDVASSVKLVIRQSFLFEYAVGKGRLVVCSFKFGEDDLAAAWLRQQLMAYAGDASKANGIAITSAQLAAAIDAPLVSGAANTNFARNVNDYSSDVRAGDDVQP